MYMNFVPKTTLKKRRCGPRRVFWESEGRKGQAVDVEDVGQQPGSPSRAWLQAGLPPVQP